MPKLVRMYIKNVLIGFALAGLFVGLMLYFNIANLWHLVSTSDKGLLAVVILWFANGIVFAGVQFAIAVMGMAEDDDDEPKGGRRAPVATREPARIKLAAPKRQARNLRR